MPTFAAVDIGSNSVRLKIARLQAGRLRALHEDREVTRLGEGVFSSGFLTPESMAETVKVLRRFHRTAQQIVPDSVRVVATSALRDARNSQAFLEWVRSATGCQLARARTFASETFFPSQLRSTDFSTRRMDTGSFEIGPRPCRI